ncbi:MAG: restriction endonuclease subunit S [Lachnospiraceae bacterium]|nr:restriction endonuclease subunit S [Lachnospiraceae bacterium]
MNYEKTTIGLHCTVTSSKRFHASERTKDGVPFYCSKEIIKKVNGEKITECDYISEDAYNRVKEEYGVPQTGDLLITTRGTYGIPYIYKEYDKFYFADGNLTWLKDFDDKLDAEYLYYWINSYEGQKKIDAIAKGTAQKAVPIALLKEIEVVIPENPIQKKVVVILKNYDQLIENNKKQIKLLEEAAQRLYKEWFIDLRFPGYEYCKIVDGVPEGWSKDRADNFFKITIGKTPPRAEKQWFVDGSVGMPWLSISDMGNAGVYVFNTSEGLTSDAVQKYNMKVVPAGTVFVSFKLTVGRVAIAIKDMCTNEAIAHFCIENDKLRAYTYCYLSNFEYDTLGNTSSISKAVNSKIIKAMPFVMPNDDTIEKFSNVVDPILNEIKVKQEICNELIEARDRLLPKLMSGEVEV